MTSPTRRWTAADLGALAVLAVTALVYALLLDQTGFWYDEVRTALSLRLPLREMIAERADSGHPPLFFVLLWFVRRLFGESEVALRVVPMLAALGSGVVGYLVLRRLGRAWAGIVAMVLLASAPQFRTVALVARPYGCVALASLVAVLLALPSRAGDRWRGALAFGAVCVVGLHLHFSALLVVAVLLVVLLARRRPRWRYAAAGGVALVAFVPFLAFHAAHGNLQPSIGWLDDLPRLSVWKAVAQPFLHTDGFGLVGPADVAAAAAVLVAALAVLGARALLPAGRLVIALWLGPWLLALGLSACGFWRLLSVSRYFASSLVAAPLVVAAAWPPRGRLGRGLVAVALTALLAVLLVESAQDVMPCGRRPWRQAARILEEHATAEEVVVVQTRCPHHWTAYHYYRPSDTYDLDRIGAPPRSVAHPDPELRPPDTWTSLRPSDAGVEGAWVYLAAPRVMTDAEVSSLDGLRRRFPVKEQHPVRRGRLLHLSR